MAATAGMNAGIFAFSTISFGMGVLMLVNTLASQAYGRKDYAAAGPYLWQGVWFGLLCAVLLLPLVPVLEWSFRVPFHHNPELLAMERVYLWIVVSNAAIKYIGVALGQFLLAINRPDVVLVSAIVGVSANVLTAFGLVLGKFGMPRMEVAGAAWAQNIGVAVETLTLVVFVAQAGIRRAYNVMAWRLHWEKFKTLLKVGIPSGGQFVVDVLAWGLFTAGVMAVLGEKAMAANNYLFRYMSVSFMPAIGVGSAVTALVGRYIGAGRPDLAQQRADLGFRVTLVYMVAMGIVFCLAQSDDGDLHQGSRGPLPGAILLIIGAFYELFDAMYIIYVGALRGAGDTFVPAVMTAVLNWSLTVGGGFLFVYVFPKLGIVGPWIGACAYGVGLGIFMLVRFRLGGWKSIKLETSTANFDKVPDSVVVPEK